jgi:uncharacterized protein
MEQEKNMNKCRAISQLLICVPLFFAIAACTSPNSVESTVALPTFGPAGTAFLNSQGISITSSTDNAAIRYTLDGSEPSRTHGYSYVLPVALSETRTIKAIAYKDGLNDSSVAAATITIVPAILAIRDSSNPLHPSTGTMLTISGVYVTAIAPHGFFIQDAALTQFGGMYAYIGGDVPTVQVGNKVTVQGTYSEYFGLSEIATTNAAVTVDDGGTALPFPPLVVGPSAIATGGTDAEKYESMLLRIESVSVASVLAGGASADAYTVSDGLIIDDFIFPNLLSSTSYPVATALSSITGVLYFASSNSKLEPRGSFDCVAAP